MKLQASRSSSLALLLTISHVLHAAEADKVLTAVICGTAGNPTIFGLAAFKLSLWFCVPLDSPQVEK
eukprot:1984784-Rhodomonas_salina.1